MDDARVAVVTGAASGFGFAVADELAARGWAIALFDVDTERVVAAAAQITAGRGAETASGTVDVGSSTDVALAAALTEEQFGRCDLLWSNVGVGHFGSIESASEDEWRWLLDVNVIGTARTVQAFLPLLRRSSDPWIALTASVGAFTPSARQGLYGASKRALVGLGDTLRYELADDGIGVSVVYPGGMMTRHIESSAAARPDHIGDERVWGDELSAAIESRPSMMADIVTPEVAAANAVSGVLNREPDVITHGDHVAAFAERTAALQAALDHVAQRNQVPR